MEWHGLWGLQLISGMFLNMVSVASVSLKISFSSALGLYVPAKYYNRMRSKGYQYWGLSMKMQTLFVIFLRL